MKAWENMTFEMEHGKDHFPICNFRRRCLAYGMNSMPIDFEAPKITISILHMLDQLGVILVAIVKFF
jgi:hypothetical protein